MLRIRKVLIKLKLVNVHIKTVSYGGKRLGFVGRNHWYYSGFVSV